MSLVQVAIARAVAVVGWLTPAQAERLATAVLDSDPDFSVVEIGSYRGKSTVVLATVAASRQQRVVAIDPFVSQWRYGAPDTEQQFRKNLAQFDLDGHVDLRVARSAEVLAQWRDPVAMLYVDGKHDVVSCHRDLAWRRFVVPDGSVFVHDAFSSVGVTAAVLVNLFAPDLRFVGRTGSLAHFVVAPPSWRDRVRLLAQLGWFARNFVIKVCLRLRMRVVAGWLNHDEAADPY